MELAFILIIPSFLAGLITFLAPCTLPLVPAYLAFISGVSGAPPQEPSVRRKVIVNGFSFVLGFSIIFVAFGALAGLAGGYLASYRAILSQIGGVIIVIFGLFILGVFRFSFFEKEHRFKLPQALSLGRPWASFLVGGSFAFGWTPCVGPILGSIILLASTAVTAKIGALLLAAFAFGLAVPFMIVAFFFAHFQGLTDPGGFFPRAVTYVGGAMLVLLGVLLATGNFSLIIEYGFKMFQFIEYDAILKYL